MLRIADYAVLNPAARSGTQHWVLTKETRNGIFGLLEIDLLAEMIDRSIDELPLISLMWL